MLDLGDNRQTYEFNPTIMRAYDIRGTIDKNLFEADAYYLGRSFASLMHKRGIKGKVCIGRDGRLSSPMLHAELIRGFVESGYDVVDIGLVATPVVYYSAYHINSEANIMVTGSHNPADQNGFKMVLQKSSFFGDNIQALAQIAKAGDFIDGKGTVEQVDIKPQYVDEIIAKNPMLKSLRVAWDPGNGATGELVQMICKKLPGKHFLINEKVDGTFPAHHPDPTMPENLDELIDCVRHNTCDIGLAFDGDGDRLGAIDNTGRIITGDKLLLVYTKDLAARAPNIKVIADVKTSDQIFNEIAKVGGQPIMWKTGHSLIKAKMKEENAQLAGEMSGHLFFGENYYSFDDALFGACKLVAIVSTANETFAQMIDTQPHCISTPEIRVDVPEEDKFNLVDAVKKLALEDQLQVNELDGVRVTEANGWWLVRASNTQNALILRVEGNTEEDLASLSTRVNGYFKKVGIEFVI